MFLSVHNIFLLYLIGAPFPPNFRDVVKMIFKRLFRVYAHIYHSHFQKIVSLKEEAHLNTCFKHFILFTCVSVLHTIRLLIFLMSFKEAISLNLPNLYSKHVPGSLLNFVLRSHKRLRSSSP